MFGTDGRPAGRILTYVGTIIRLMGSARPFRVRCCPSPPPFAVPSKFGATTHEHTTVLVAWSLVSSTDGNLAGVSRTEYSFTLVAVTRSP